LCYQPEVPLLLRCSGSEQGGTAQLASKLISEREGDVMRAWRRNALGLVASACLLSVPWVAADAANEPPTE
jgi:hypothetical protein